MPAAMVTPWELKKKTHTHKQKKNNKMGKKYTQWRAKGASSSLPSQVTAQVQRVE